MRAIADRYRGLGRDVIAVDEDAVWGERRLGPEPVNYATAWPAFYELLHKPGGSRPQAGDDLLELFSALVDDAVRRRAVWVQDWSWTHLIRLIGWDEQLIGSVSARMGEIAEAVSPLLIHLRVDPQVALRRALEERGAVWFNRHVAAPLGIEVTPEFVRSAARRFAAWQHAAPHVVPGWEVRVVDAHGPSRPVWRERCSTRLRLPRGNLRNRLRRPTGRHGGVLSRNGEAQYDLGA